VLSRALCRFERFRPPQDLSRKDQALAARLKAEEASPFADGAATLFRHKDEIAIWHWDRGVVSALVPGFDWDRGIVAPETVLREPGEGWRLIACLDGFEAQYWEEGSLRASSWKRETFSLAQWQAFAFGVGETRTPAPLEPPSVEFAPMHADGAWRKQLIAAPFSWRDAERSALLVAAAGVLAASLWAGYGARSASDASASRALIAASAADVAKAGDVRRQEDLLKTFNEIVDGHRLAHTAVDIAEVFKILNIDLQEWKLDRERFEARVPNPPEDGRLGDIVRALEASESLQNVDIDLAESREGEVLDVTAEVRPEGREP
jgi:hypothetical protein